MKTIKLLPEQWEQARTDLEGVHSFILRSRPLRYELAGRYLRSNLCLKVFHETPTIDVKNYQWGQNSFWDCCVIQNLLARWELAPRIYDWVLVNDQMAQVTEYVEEEGEWCPEEVERFQAEYGLKISWDMNPKNWRGGKLVDLQSFRFHDPHAYVDRLKSLAYQHAAWGSRSEPYQMVDALFTEGQRDFSSRRELLKLGVFNWPIFSVLDIGCNLGTFLHYVTDQGARRVVGIDLPHVADTAFEIANFLGYWNIDFLGLNLAADEVDLEERFDVVFALSVGRQIGLRPWMAKLTKNIFLWEGHVPDHEHTWRQELEKYFQYVEFLGTSRDHGPRPVFRCFK